MEFSEDFVTKIWDRESCDTVRASRLSRDKEMYLAFEISHLHKAAELLKKYEKKEWEEVIKDPKFPKPLSLHENIEYVRKILGETVQYTSDREDYVRVKDLSGDADFFRFQ